MTAFSVPENLAFDTYSELSDAIADWLDRSDLEGNTQTMIALAEARMRRLLEPMFNEITAAVTVVDGCAPLPTDYSTARRVHCAGVDIIQRPPLARDDLDNTLATFTIERGKLFIWPAVSTAVSLTYQPRLQQLSEANPSNDLLQHHPDLYFYGAMMFAEGYLDNDQRALLFKNLWDEALGEAKRYFMRQRYPGRLVPRLANVA